MPRFFFDTFDGASHTDQEGLECRNIEHAKQEAALFAAGLLRDDPENFWATHTWTVTVRDEAGLQLCELLLIGTSAPVLSGKPALQSI